MGILYALTGLLLVLSLLASPGKTASALRIARRRFVKIAPAFIVMLVLVAVALHFLPGHVMARMLACESKWVAAGGALGLGAVSIMPGFIAFPLCGIMLSRGALYMVLAAFSTSLMMVGVVTFPLEKEYLGTRLAVARNVVSLVVAMAVAVAVGLYFGELP